MAKSNHASSQLTNALMLIGAPLVVALAAAWMFVDSARDAESASAAVDMLRTGVVGFFALGAAVSLALTYRRLSESSGSSDRLDELLVRIAASDYTAAAAIARDELSLGANGERALRELQERATKLTTALAAQRTALDGLHGSIGTLADTLHTQTTTTTDIARVMDDSIVSHRGISESVDGLSRSAEATSSSILQMVAINNEVTENTHNLALSVQETTTAIEEMTFSVKEVAKNIEELSTAAEETAASMNEMDVSISQVETNANETSKLSETVTTDAETGVSAINKTIQGIDKIKESSRVAAQVIGSLGQKIGEIGNILTVIDDVAEQTNLLALNAAIIAAQAGEHGRGFAVVADEIKALAERTGSSTKEIATLIKAVQDESRNAISVMSQGVSDVEEGVRLGHNAEDALRKIVESAKRSTLMIKAIAQATVEQSKGSKQVTNAISRIAETVQQIAIATGEQAKGSEQIIKSAERMKVITQQVERSTEEQNRGGRQMTEAIENIREMVEQINQAQAQQVRGTERVGAGMSQMRSSCDRASDLCKNLARSLSDGVHQLDNLERQLRG